MELVIEKIKDIRKKKGYSHEYMAHELDISQVAYSKIEKFETKLSVDRLYKIAEILETPIEDFLDINAKNIFNQNDNKLNDNSMVVGNIEIQHLYQENKEKTEKIEKLYEARLQDKDIMINELKRIIDSFKK